MPFWDTMDRLVDDSGAHIDSLSGMISLKPDVPLIRRYLQGPAPGWMAVSRGAALGLSVLMALNLMEVFVHSTSSVTNWLTNLRPLTQPIGITILAMAATSLLMFAMKPELPGPVQFASLALMMTFIGCCGRELWQLSDQIVSHQRTTAMIRPLGILMLYSVAGIGVINGNRESVRGHSSLISILVSVLLTIVGFAVVTVQTGGLSDPLPRQPAPAILVIGERLEEGGKLTEEVIDRLATGCRLVIEKRGRLLILSGQAEVKAMRSLAVSEGVPEDQIVTDENGASLDASLLFAAKRPELQRDPELVAISHWYHLARIRLLGRRAGLEILAIGAEQKHALFNQNMLVAQEVGSLLATLCEPAINFARNAPPEPSSRANGLDADLE